MFSDTFWLRIEAASQDLDPGFMPAFVRRAIDRARTDRLLRACEALSNGFTQMAEAATRVAASFSEAEKAFATLLPLIEQSKYGF